MADDLDALFGAFDGDVGSNKDHVVDDQSAAAVPERKAETKTDNEDDAANDSELPQPSAYTTIMSKETASHLKTADSQNDKDQAPTDDAEEKEIATGTSHDKSVRSYSAYPKNLPPGNVYTPVEPPKTPSKQYPFPLDPFQSQAISYIDKEESVLVAAHTSAGKTAVAEYAIAKSLKAGQRVVYTSPIKALSNQKFRDLQEEFHDVGLMTGDITINPASTCLVMTTEILRSMLYRGSEIMREVAWVIYDEVHYMRDVERGVVWEESIILLPHKVRFVFLSATIPNAAQFADWIAEIHHQPCHVVYTNYRPVPLQHYIFPQGSEGLHLVVDERGKFREANFQRAMAALQSGNADAAAAEAMLASGNGKGKKRKKRGGKKGGHTSDLFRIVKLIMDRNLNPVIVFSFSKKDCEKYALDLNSEDYTDDIEKDLISQVYRNAIESLSEDDRNLPQVVALLPLLKRGIGIHHGGLLPILKEIVEILFSEGLIKALFATETFSIGINMPAKTVVFTNTRKWDGKDFRWVTSGEYIQMSGRAGRRGKDDRGIVIQMLDEKMEPAVCKGILYGEPDPLNSSYRISYNMLLNMMRVEDVDPEYLLRASFHQFQKETDVPGLLEQAKDFEIEAASIDLGPSEEVELVSQYYQMDQQLLVTQRKMKEFVRRPEYVLKFLQKPGRFLYVVIDGEAYGWGVLLSCKKKQGTGTGGSAGRLAEQTAAPQYSLEVLLFCVDRHFDSVEGKERDEDIENRNLLWQGSSRQCRPVQVGVDEEKIVSMRVFAIGLESIDRISAVRIFIPSNHPSEMRKDVALSVKEVQKRFPDGIPLLDPVKDLGINDQDFMTLFRRAEALNQRLVEHKLAKDFSEEGRMARVQAFEKRAELLASAKAIREQARLFETVTMKEDLKKMKRVLKRLGHVDANGVIQTKGRTACEINTADELVVVELIFTGVFNDLSVEQCCALLSCMTYDERNKDEDNPAKGLKSYLANPFYKLQEVARTVAKAAIACKIELDEDQFVEQFNPGM